MDILVIIGRTFFYYFTIIILYRIMGKREVGELSIIDLVVSVSIAQFASISIENYEEPLIHTLIPIFLFVSFQIILSIVSMKNLKVRTIIDGNPSVIIKEGKINFKEMTKQRYNLDDLLIQIRDRGIRSLEEVEYAILETSGRLSIFRYNPEKKNYPMPLILDGEIQYDTLTDIKKDYSWVKKMLKQEKVKLENVFYAFYKGQKTFIIKKDEIIK